MNQHCESLFEAQKVISWNDNGHLFTAADDLIESAKSKFDEETTKRFLGLMEIEEVFRFKKSSAQTRNDNESILERFLDRAAGSNTYEKGQQPQRR